MKTEPEQELDPIRRRDAPGEPDDLPAEAIRQSRVQTRLNALTLLAVLLLTTFASYPWGLLAPILFLAPLGYAIMRRLRAARKTEPTPEPYSSVSKDPQDPRRYKPIG